jgi:NAD+ kinase
MRVLLVPHTGNANAIGATVELSTWLLGQGFEPVLAQSDAEAVGLPDFGVAPSDFGELVLVVALGGDGTILKAVHLLGAVEVPVLGVKFGRLGFLSGTTPHHMRQAVTTALAGEARIERRATLKAQIMMEGRELGEYFALNEVVISRGDSGRVVAFDLCVDGHKLYSTRADGFVIATATGSTAYALSAGGPIVSPSFGGMVVVPVAPHTLASRAIVTEPSDSVEITLPDPTRSDACLVVDGHTTPCRRALERLTVARGETDVLLVKLEGRGFYETLAAEFFGS